MKIKDLKAGMLVELRNGDECILIPNKDGLSAVDFSDYKSSNYGWASRIGKYSDDFTDIDGLCDFDIMKVWGLSCVSPLAPKEKRQLLWERKPKIELTPCEKDILRLLGQIGYDHVSRTSDFCVWAHERGVKSLIIQTSSFDQLGKDGTVFSIKELLKGE